MDRETLAIADLLTDRIRGITEAAFDGFYLVKLQHRSFFSRFWSLGQPTAYVNARARKSLTTSGPLSLGRLDVRESGDLPPKIELGTILDRLRFGGRPETTIACR